jgi:hydrogenase maturation protease
MTLATTDQAKPASSPANARPARCLILACGNTLRSDDGIGPMLAAWAEERFREQPDVRVISRQQWTPDLAEDIANTDSVLFIDASASTPPGRVRLIPVSSRTGSSAPNSHHLKPSELLSLTRSLYQQIKSHAMLLTINVSSTELGETFSKPVEAALPRARGILEKAVLRFLER